LRARDTTHLERIVRQAERTGQLAESQVHVDRLAGRGVGAGDVLLLSVNGERGGEIAGREGHGARGRGWHEVRLHPLTQRRKGVRPREGVRHCRDPPVVRITRGRRRGLVPATGGRRERNAARPELQGTFRFGAPKATPRSPGTTRTARTRRFPVTVLRDASSRLRFATPLVF